MRTDILEKKEEILQWIKEEQPKNYICQQLKCKQETLNKYLKKMNIYYDGQQSKKGQAKGNHYKNAMFYIETKTPITSFRLKEKLIKDGLKEEKCEICGCSEWLGQKIPLELHHKDRDHFNNQLDNIQILCPNCHSIQPGNSGANIDQYVAVLEQVDNTLLDSVPNKGMGSNPISNTKSKYCIDCGKVISINATRCKSCANKFRQSSKSPNREELKYLIRTTSFVQIGKIFNVSDNAVRKWCKTVNLPYKIAEIKKYTDEEWDKI